MIPLRGDILKSQPKWLALSGRERRQIEIYRFIIRSAGAQNAQGQFLALRNLSHFVLERYLHHRMGDRLITGIGDGAIEIADRRARKILRGACLQV